MKSLAQGYGADITGLEVKNSWIAHEACPPRHGPSQNLAGMIDNAAEMAPSAIHACAYVPKPQPSEALLQPLDPKAPLADHFRRYDTMVMREVKRLKDNIGGARIFLVLDTGRGYVQCEPQSESRALYCEAQSVDSDPALKNVLTPDREAILHAAGFDDPGPTQNYSRIYPIDKFDSIAIADALLTILHDVYGYAGTPPLDVVRETGDTAGR